MSTALTVELSEAGSDPDRIDDLTMRLRRELLELDVDKVVRVSAGEAPEGSRAIDIAAVGALLVTVQQSRAIVASVVNTIREWLKRDPQPNRTVKVTIEGRTIDITNATEAQIDQLVAAVVQPSRGNADAR